nr:synaptogyrin-2b isoform X2 [Misgurnus anguillicaudatus]
MEVMHLFLIGISVWSTLAGAFDINILEKPQLFGPSRALEGSIVEYFCEVPMIPPDVSVLLTLYMERNMNKLIGEHTVNYGENVTFPVRVTKAYDGQFICEASGNNNTLIGKTFSNSLELKVISPVDGASITSHPSTDDLWEGQSLTLYCNITKGTHVSYDWLVNGKSVHTGSSLTIQSLSVQHTGDYQCVASNQVNDTMVFNSSSDVTSVWVKEYISKPEISMDVMKIGVGIFIILKCRSDKGTQPKTFSLFNDTKVINTKTTEGLQVDFNVSIELNRDMGWVRCNASNDGNWMLSEPISLTVESVGGAVMVTPFKHIGRDFEVFGLVLRCKVERGTFPHYDWYLNNSRLMGQGRFYVVVRGDLVLNVGAKTSGIYHCEASDRFDNSTRITSPKMLISKEVLNRVSTSVVVVVFSGFILIIIAVTACCIYGVVLRRRYPITYQLHKRYGETKVTSKQKDEDEEDNDEDEEDDYLMMMDYEEDLIRTDRLYDSEEDEQSIDESVLYEEAVSKSFRSI